MKVQITPLTPQDIPEVVEIERESNLEPWSRESFLEELDRLHSHVFVARFFQAPMEAPETTGDERPEKDAESGTGSRVAGYICIWCVADEIQVLNVAVHRACRRLGIGRALLSFAFEHGCGKQARKAVLEVRSSNIAAQMLYKSAGFRVVGERPDYYGVLKESAILMEKKLEA